MISPELSRRTKLIWSFESQNLNSELVDTVVQQDCDALRIVYDSDSSDRALKFIGDLEAAGKSRGRSIPIMLDIGTDVRSVVTGIDEPKELAFGDRVKITKDGSSEAGGLFQVRAEDWQRLFAADVSVIIGFGNVVLKTTGIGPQSIDAEVVQGGKVYPGSSVHVPDTRLAPTSKDVPLKDLKKFLAHKIDFVVLPGLVSREEIEIVREQIKANGGRDNWILLKIDSHELVRRVEEVLPAVDGILISRMELAVSMNPATIPMVTKELIQTCNDLGKVVLTASEMLGSMRNNPTPTRAEVSDVANAVIDGTDGVVLSEIVAKGNYSVRALGLMQKIISDVETNREVRPNWLKESPTIATEMDAISLGAYRTAERLGAKALVCITKGGVTAVRLASFRPPIPIIAVTFDEDVLRRLKIVNGVSGIVLDIDPSIDQVFPLVNERLLKDSWLKVGDRIIFVSVTLSSVGREASNLFSVQRLT